MDKWDNYSGYAQNELIKNVNEQAKNEKKNNNQLQFFGRRIYYLDHDMKISRRDKLVNQA